jgi:CHASE2 domain-containing sensor protein
MENQDKMDSEHIPAPKPLSNDKSTWKSIGKSLISGVMVALVIFLAKWCVKDTGFYKGWQKATYESLQAWLSPPQRRDDLPIMIVDIRDLEYKTIQVEGDNYSLTPRDKLIPLIEAVAAQNPKVVAVDIDFSPHKIGALDPADPIHFQNLAKLKVPIFLGIYRSRNRPRELWLGHPQFESLGANLANPDDNRKMFEWTSGADGRKELTMCKAVANAFPEKKKTASLFFLGGAASF